MNMLKGAVYLKFKICYQHIAGSNPNHCINGLTPAEAFDLVERDNTTRNTIKYMSGIADNTFSYECYFYMMMLNNTA